MTARVDLFEARPGGRYQMTLTYGPPSDAGHGKSSADADVVRGRFLELIPNERIVQEVEFESADPAFAGTMKMTWTFAKTQGGTEVTITAENVPDGIRAEDHQEGLHSTLENLAAFAVSRS